MIFLRIFQVLKLSFNRNIVGANCCRYIIFCQRKSISRQALSWWMLLERVISICTMNLCGLPVWNCLLWRIGALYSVRFTKALTGSLSITKKKLKARRRRTFLEVNYA